MHAQYAYSESTFRCSRHSGDHRRSGGSLYKPENTHLQRICAVSVSSDAAAADSNGAITSKIKRAIKHTTKLETSPARLAQLLQPSLAFCFSLQPMTGYAVIGCKLKNANEGCNSCATIVQVLQDLFYVYCMFYCTCDRSLKPRHHRR